MAPCESVVEHVVLFKVRDGTPGPAVESCLTLIRSLQQLDGVLCLHAGAVVASLPVGGWTHAVYGRYRDKEALNAYLEHPMHHKVVVEARKIAEDGLSLDWEAKVDSTGTGCGRQCGAVRVVLVEWKEGVKEDEIAAVVHNLADSPGVEHYTAGPNFSFERAKGFQWGFVGLIASAKKQLQDLQDNSQLEHLADKRIIERFLLFDFGIN